MVWKRPLEIISSNPLLEQAHPEQGAQERIQVGFVESPSLETFNLPGQPVPPLWHPHRKEVFSHIEVELAVFQLVPVAPCPVIGHY